MNKNSNSIAVCAENKPCLKKNQHINNVKHNGLSMMTGMSLLICIWALLDILSGLINTNENLIHLIRNWFFTITSF